MSKTTNNVNAYIEDPSLRPGGRANAQGQIQRLKFEIMEFNDTCNCVRLSYMVRKNQQNSWLDISLAPAAFSDFIIAIDECANNRDFPGYTIPEKRGKNKDITYAEITVFRDEEKAVCLKLKCKEEEIIVKFLPLAAYQGTSNGSALPINTLSERNARACCKVYQTYHEVLMERFKKFVFKDGGFSPRPQSNAQPQQQQSHGQTQPTTNADGFF